MFKRSLLVAMPVAIGSRSKSAWLCRPAPAGCSYCEAQHAQRLVSRWRADKVLVDGMLFARAVPGSRFVAWKRAGDGTGPCTLTLATQITGLGALRAPAG